MGSVTETPILKKDCQIPECKKAPKGFKTSRGLKGHMEKFHQILIDVVSTMTDTARVLFGENQSNGGLAPQGNSHGALNSPEVVSEGEFLCGNCNSTCKSNIDAMNHKCDNNDKAKAAKDNDNPQQFEETEEVDLVESLDEAETCIAVNLIENTMAAKKVELLVNQTIDKRYDTVINNEGNTNKDSHECNLKEEKISGQEKVLDENEMKKK